MHHLLLTDLEGKPVLASVDFAFAVIVQVQKKQPSTEKVVSINAKIERRTVTLDATALVYAPDFTAVVVETPEEIYQLLQELDYEAVYEPEEGSDSARGEELSELSSSAP